MQFGDFHLSPLQVYNLYKKIMEFVNWEVIEFIMEAIETAKKVILGTLQYLSPSSLVKNEISLVDQKTLLFQDKRFPFNKLYCLAIGKGASRMAQGARKCLGDSIDWGGILTKYGYREDVEDFEYFEAGHPLPDENGIEATKEILKKCKKLGEKDLLLFLVSGGGSALFTLPENNIDLQEMIKVNELLLRSGASIDEINCVRKHIDRVKGGKFAEECKATIVSLMLSDVVKNAPSVIASGPVVPDPSTFSDALRILKAYDLSEKVPDKVLSFLRDGTQDKVKETPKKLRDKVFYKVFDSAWACEMAKKVGKDMGIRSYILSTSIEGEAKEVGRFLTAVGKDTLEGKTAFKPPCIIISGGETTVTLNANTQNGIGGPNQEVVVSFSIYARGTERIALASIDTDGTDGPTDIAGGAADGKTFEKMKRHFEDPTYAFNEHNAYKLLTKSGCAIKTGPTGTNVNDLRVLVVL